MGYAFPLSIDDFFGGLHVTSVQWTLTEAMNVSQDKAGFLYPYDMGERLWRGSVTLAPMPWGEMNAVKAKLDLLRQAGRSALFYDKTCEGPQADPAGVVLGSAIPTLATVATDNRTIGLANLPGGYVITAGDMLAFQYLSGPVRYALHRVVTGGISAADGTLGSVEVVPALRAGWAVGAAISLMRPACRAIYVPGSIKEPTAVPGGISSGLGFDVLQTLK